MAVKNFKIPDKKYLNLVINDRPPYYYRKLLIGCLIGAALIGVFAKFAVVDRIIDAATLERQARSEQVRYEKLVDDNAVFAEVRAEHEKYFTSVGGGAVFADCLDVLNLIENALLPAAGLQSCTLSGDTLAVVLTGIDLTQASSIVQTLYNSDTVVSVTLSSADTTSDDAVSTTSMSIQLVTESAEVTK